MNKDTRYQGLIIQNDRILLIRGYEKMKGNSFWVIPGGHREAGESIEDCLIREMHEETNLEVQVDRLLMEMTFYFDDLEGTNKSYLCRPIGGEVKTGFEPEDENFVIAALRWFDLTDDQDWSRDLQSDPITYPVLALVRLILGYTNLV